MRDKNVWYTAREAIEAGNWPVPWSPIIGLIPIINEQGPNLIGIEVGACGGQSSFSILDECPNVDKVYGIDPYIPFMDNGSEVSQEHVNQVKEVCLLNMEEFGDRFELIVKTSEQVIIDNMFLPNSVDFIFIDGNHNHDYALYDFRNYYPLLKPNGIFSGHDLGIIGGALNTFRDDNKIEPGIISIANSSWYWRK